MGTMRVAVGICAIALLSCAAEEGRMENQMDLTLGGDNPSLREDLSRIDEARGYVVRPRPPTPVFKPEPKPKPKPKPKPEPPQLSVVILQDGDTLWGLAETHLGAGNRWRELARLNGWSEERASQLPAGTRVKLPRD